MEYQTDASGQISHLASIWNGICRFWMDTTSHQAVSQGNGDGMGAVDGVEFGVDVLNVIINRNFTDTLNAGNFPRGFSFGQPFQDIAFSRGEITEGILHIFSFGG